MALLEGYVFSQEDSLSALLWRLDKRGQERHLMPFGRHGQP